MGRKAIAIDFDGCLCQNNWPEIGTPNWDVINAAKQEKAAGAGLILWTCREGEMLHEALVAVAKWGLTFDAVNDNLPDWKAAWGNNPRKIGASEYWDDRAVRVPPDKPKSVFIDSSEAVARSIKRSIRMTDREKQLIASYIPSPRDPALDDFEYYAKDIAGRIFKVHISGIHPHMKDDTTYSVYTDGGRRITDSTNDGNFPMRHLYDNKQDCKNETHNWFNDWECLRELQENGT